SDEPGCRFHRRVRGAAFGLLGHGSLLSVTPRAPMPRARLVLPHGTSGSHGVMASRGASVNPLTAVPDRSEIAERPPRGRRIRSQRTRDTGRHVSAHRESGGEKICPRSRKLRSRLDNDRSRRGCIMKRAIFLLVGAAVALGFSAAASAQTLKAVKDRGSLICGVSQGLPGFSNPDDKGNWTGFDVDFCR